MHVGVCTISNKEMSVEEVMDVVATTPAAGIEVWGQDHVGSGTTERCADIAAAAADRGLEIPVYGSYLRAGTDTFDADVDRELRIAEALGADAIRVWAGSEEHQDVSEDHWTAVVEDLTQLGEAAAALDLHVTVERHAGTVTNTTEGAVDLIDATPANVGLNYQPPFDMPADDIAADIRELAPITTNAHLQAVQTVGERSRCPLGFAYFDVADIVTTLADADFDGYLEIEFVTDRAPYRAAVAADVAILQALLDGS